MTVVLAQDITTKRQAQHYANQILLSYLKGGETMKKKPKPERPVRSERPVRISKLDQLTASTAQEWTHAHTATISSKRRVLQCAAEESDRAIVALSAALANEREHRARIDAQLRGMTEVISKRNGC